VSMAVTLPYQFDTSGAIRLILGGVLGLLALVVVPGILYSLFISHSIAAAVQLALIGTLAAWFGWVVVRNLSASVGTITTEAVVVRPPRFYGIQLPGPAGQFPLRQFRAIRVERIFGPLWTAQLPRWHERVSVLGAAGTPDILIARTERNAGLSLGQELATLLALEYEQVIAPA
jgi:hypothetical protein